MEIKKILDYKKAWIKRTETKYIILHHAESIDCTIQDIEYWHLIQNNWAGGCGYHFFIDKNGIIFEGRPIDVIGAHCLGYNDKSIGICFGGNFDKEFMPEIQINAGISLVKWIRTKYNVPVMRHKDLNNTACPGKHFNDDIILKGMKDDMDNQQTHWAESIFNELNNKGIKITEKRFEDNIKRGEAMALIKQVIEFIERK